MHCNGTLTCHFYIVVAVTAKTVTPSGPASASCPTGENTIGSYVAMSDYSSSKLQLSLLILCTPPPIHAVLTAKEVIVA
jgi:hypothetical protein